MLHDGPLDLPRGGKGLGTPMVQTPARAAGSADNTQATSFFLINDSGVWLIKKLKKLNLLSEPDGERALFLDDWRPFVPRTLRASAGSRCAKTIRSRMRVEFADLRHGFHAKAHSYQMAVSAIGRRDAESRHPPQSSACLSHASSWFQLAKFRLTSLRSSNAGEGCPAIAR